MRGIRRLVVVLLLALASMPASASAAIPAGRFGVGDSIMLSAEDELAAYDVGINAEVGRQFSEAIPIVRRLVKNERLPRNVIVHLGTNGYIQQGDCDRLVELATGRRIFLVTIKVPREWQTPNNDLLNGCAATYERVFIIRWFAYSNDHPEWFAEDGYHPNADGQQAYADLIDGDVTKVLKALR